MAWNDSFDWIGAGALGAYNNSSVGNQNGLPVNQNDSLENNPPTDQWWQGENISGYADSVATLLSVFSGKPKGPDTVIYQQETQAEKKGISTGALIGIILAVVLLLILVLTVAFKRNK